VGLIGSSAKWSRFRSTLLADDHDAEAVDRIVTPIGTPSLAGKEPATIAVSVAAALLQSFADDAVPAPGPPS